MLTDNSGSPLIPTAKISVGNLQQNGDGGCNNVEFSLADNADGKVSIRGYGLKTEIIVQGEVDLQFEFVAPTLTGEGANRHTYVPIGISFEEETTNDFKKTSDDDTWDDSNCGAMHVFGDPLGLNAFPERRIVSANGTTLLIVRDKYPHIEVEACFKFSLIIQNPDGKVRIIDPKIRNVPM